MYNHMLPQLNLISFFSFFHYQPFGEGDPVIVDETGVDIIQALDIFSPTQPSSPASHRTIPPGSRSFQVQDRFGVGAGSFRRIRIFIL